MSWREVAALSHDAEARRQEERARRLDIDCAKAPDWGKEQIADAARRARETAADARRRAAKWRA